MHGDRLPLFCDSALAERIERAEAQLIAKGSEAARQRRADTVGFVIPIAGGVAGFAEEEFEAWLDVVAEGVAHPDGQGVPSHEEFPREAIANTLRDLTTAAGVTRYAALRDAAQRATAGLRPALHARHPGQAALSTAEA